MAIAVEHASRRYINISAGVGIAVDIPAFEAADIKVYYGKAGLLAIQNTDYTVTLGEGFSTFTITPTLAFAAKITALIAADATESNFILVRREQDYETEANPASVRYTDFVAKEFDRVAMRIQQLLDRTNRSVQLGPQFTGDVPKLRIDSVVPGAGLVYGADGKSIVPGGVSGGGVIGGSYTRTWELISGATTLTPGQSVATNTGTGPFTVSLPAAPQDGDAVSLSVILGNPEVNPLTVSGNGNLIGVNGFASDSSLVINVPLPYVEIAYFASLGEWKLVDYAAEPSTGAGTVLDDLVDVDIISPDDGEGLIWSASEAKFINGAVTYTGSIAGITGLQAELDGKADTSHNHAIADVTNLQSTLDGKAATSHTHSIANVTGLQGALDGKAATPHTHVKANITDFNDADYATAAQGTKADTALQPEDVGTAAALNVAASGDAAAGEVVKGDDTRLAAGSSIAVSGLLTFPADGNAAFAHGLGSAPTKFGGYLVAKGTPNGGYAVGDRLHLSSSTGGEAALYANATNVVFALARTDYRSATATGSGTNVVWDASTCDVVLWAEE